MTNPESPESMNDTNHKSPAPSKESLRGGRPKTGTVVRTRAGLWQGVVTLADGSRMRLEPYPKGTSEAMAREKTAYWAEKFADKKNPNASPKRSAKPGDTAQSWIDCWLADKTERGQTSVRDKRAHWEHHLKPVLGTKHPKKWTSTDLRKLVAKLDEHVREGAISWKTAKNIWGTCTSICSDAVSSKQESLRCRDDNPAATVKGPDRGTTKEKEFLYPREFSKLMACPDVPLRLRRLVAFATFTGLRRAEIQLIDWADVDLDHATVFVHQAKDRNTGEAKSTKGKSSRRIPLHPNLLPLLYHLRGLTGGKGRVLANMPHQSEFSDSLRQALIDAGCDRRSLHQSTATNKRLAFHDLRTTYATWLALDAVDALTIKQRMGHKHLTTTEGYVSTADAVRGEAGQPFPPLPESLFQAEAITGLVTTGLEVAFLGSKLASPAGFEPASSP